MPELLGRREIGPLPVGAKTNKLIAKHVHTRAGVNFHLYLYYVILVTTGQYKTLTVVGRPHLVRSPRFIHKTMFYTQSVMLSPRFIPQSALYTSVRVVYPVRSLQSAVHSPCFIPTGRLFSQKAWELCGPVKPSLVYQYIKPEKRIRLKLNGENH